MAIMARSRPPPLIERADLLAQRRLLLSFTFSLSAIHLLEVRWDGKATMQGLTLSFEHSYLIVVALWIAWAWSIWRYWQYERHYSYSRLEAEREQEIDKRAAVLVRRAIQEAVARGEYESRGLGRHEQVDVLAQAGDSLSVRDINASTWEFANLDIWRRDQTDGQRLRLDGGANCTLSARDTKRVKRAVQVELVLRHPYLGDWKAPYFLLWLAPISFIVDVLRGACFN